MIYSLITNIMSANRFTGAKLIDQNILVNRYTSKYMVCERDNKLLAYCKYKKVNEVREFIKRHKKYSSCLQANGVLVPKNLYECKIDYVDEYKQTALMYTVSNGMEKTALELLDYFNTEFDISRKDYNGYTLFSQACSRRYEKITLKLIDLCPKSMCGSNYMDRSNSTPLILTCKYELKKTVLKLINTSGDDCLPEHVDLQGRTALSYACTANDKYIASMLITAFENKCIPGHADVDNKTALFYACDNKNGKHIASILIEKLGDICDPGHASYNGFTALMNACRYHEMIAVRLIEVFGTLCNLGYVSNSGNTALSIACRNGQRKTALILITKFGADCNPKQVDDSGFDAFKYACRNPKLKDVVTEITKYI